MSNSTTNVSFDSFLPNKMAYFPTKMYNKIEKKYNFLNNEGGCGTLNGCPRNTRVPRHTPVEKHWVRG